MRLVGGDIHGRLPISLGHLGWSMLYFCFLFIQCLVYIFGGHDKDTLFIYSDLLEL